MLIQREDANGDLYQMSLFSAGVLFGQSPRQRAERRKVTEKAKQEINKRAAVWRLMQLICANFTPGKDLFVCLTYRDTPEDDDGRTLEKFHRRARAAYAKIGLTYRYICATERHDMDGTPVRLHHHLILPGAYGVRLADLLGEAWGHGAVDVRTLRDKDDFFRDTAMYLLKEDKPRGARRYSTSRNLHPPAEPVRLRLPESESGEVPPGVVVVESTVYANTYGKYQYMVGRIYDHVAFDAYWARQRKRAAPDPWERLRRRHRRIE